MKGGGAGRRVFAVLAGGMIVVSAVFGGGGVIVKDLAPEFPGGEKWLNTRPIKVRDLKNKVLLIDFWEYTCVNCLRTLPYVKKWHRKYRDAGLVVIGVHTPEFEVSSRPENVEAFAKAEGLDYPIVLDNRLRIWNAYQGQGGFWPRKFLIDRAGRVRFDIIGEGQYEATERKVQELLKEVDPTLPLEGFVGYEREEDEPGVVCYPRTTETYAGYHRGVFATIPRRDRIHTYTASPILKEGQIALNGRFRVETERILHSEATTGDEHWIELRWKGSEINAVMEPGKGGETTVLVTVDGRPIKKEMRGRDTALLKDGNTALKVDFPRMYQIVAGKEYGEYRLRMQVRSAGLALYAFTFGSCSKPPS